MSFYQNLKEKNKAYVRDQNVNAKVFVYAIIVNDSIYHPIIHAFDRHTLYIGNNMMT